jgi:glycosyltransferase involved in cell wall biosynthesis
MRIAHIVQDLDPAMGGLATVPITMAAWQARFGAEVELWTASAHGAERSAADAGLRLVERPGPAGLLDRGFFSRFADDLARVDVIHTHSFWRPYTLRFILTARALGKTAVHTMHGMFMEWPFRQKTLKKRVQLALAGRRALRACSAVHMLNASESAQSRGVGANFRYFELPNGVDTAEFAALPPAGALRASDPSLVGKTIIASLGRLHEVKGPDLLLRAFLDVAEEFPGTILILAGPDEGSRPMLERMIAQDRHGDRVRLPGLVRGDARLALLAECDLFVQSSRHETMSMSILEAAYASRCLLLTERCNAPEVAESDAGLVVATSVEGLRDGLRRLLRDPVGCARRGAAARRMVDERFTLKRVVPQMLEHYRNLQRGERYPWLLEPAPS